MGERSQTVNSPFDNFSGGTEGTRMAEGPCGTEGTRMAEGPCGTEGTRMAEGRRSRRSCRRQGPEGATGPVEDRNDLTGTSLCGRIDNVYCFVYNHCG